VFIYSPSVVSVLFNEPKLLKLEWYNPHECKIARFSALQRAEIAEICWRAQARDGNARVVSVLFNEPKLLKCALVDGSQDAPALFQCSSTSRNC